MFTERELKIHQIINTVEQRALNLTPEMNLNLKLNCYFRKYLKYGIYFIVMCSILFVGIKSKFLRDIFEIYFFKVYIFYVLDIILGNTEL